MIFLNVETGEYPRHQGDLELLGWKEGEPLPENWVEVQYVNHPEITEKQEFLQLPPAEEDGIWKMRWIVRNLTEDEYQEKLIKIEKQKTFLDELLSPQKNI